MVHGNAVIGLDASLGPRISDSVIGGRIRSMHGTYRVEIPGLRIGRGGPNQDSEG
jgi:hypothetical protein